MQASVPERLPDKVAAAVTPWKRAMGRVLAGCGVGLCRSSRYPMQWQPETPREETELAVQLLELGFPDYVLQDLRPEEIESCRGAIQVVVGVQEFDQEGGFCHSSGSNPLCIIGGRGKAGGKTHPMDDLPPLSLEHGSVLPRDRRRAALAGIPVG